MPDSRFGSLLIEDSGGDGQAIVMLHGLGGSSNTFEPILQDLDDYRVLRPDLPGAGRSGLRPAIRTIAGMSRAVTDALLALRVSRALIVAHSMGTLLAQHMAVSAPHRVQGLLLFGAISEPPEAARLALRSRASSAMVDGMSNIATAVAQTGLSEKTRAENPAAVAFVRESVMRQSPVGYAAHCNLLASSLACSPMQIRVPVHLVTGAEDVVAPRAMAEKMNNELPFSKLEILTGVGHWPTLEAPVACRRALADVLDASSSPDVIERN